MNILWISGTKIVKNTHSDSLCASNPIETVYHYHDEFEFQHVNGRYSKTSIFQGLSAPSRTRITKRASSNFKVAIDDTLKPTVSPTLPNFRPTQPPSRGLATIRPSISPTSAPTFRPSRVIRMSDFPSVSPTQSGRTWPSCPVSRVRRSPPGCGHTPTG